MNIEELTERFTLIKSNDHKKDLLVLSHIADRDSMSMVKGAVEAALKHQHKMVDEDSRKKFIHKILDQMTNKSDPEEFLSLLKKHFHVKIEK